MIVSKPQTYPQGTFVQLSKKITLEAHRILSAEALVLLIWLLSQPSESRTQKYVVNPTYKKLSREFSVSERTIAGWIKELKEKGYLKLIRFNYRPDEGKSCVKWFVFESPMKEKEAKPPP